MYHPYIANSLATFRFNELFQEAENARLLKQIKANQAGPQGNLLLVRLKKLITGRLTTQVQTSSNTPVLN